MKKLRKSQYKDYVAVDVVINNKIISTPIYLTKGKPQILMSKDVESGIWFKTQVIFNGNILECVDIDPKSDYEGLKWESPIDELIDIFKPL